MKNSIESAILQAYEDSLKNQQAEEYIRAKYRYARIKPEGWLSFIGRMLPVIGVTLFTIMTIMLIGQKYW